MAPAPDPAWLFHSSPAGDDPNFRGRGNRSSGDIFSAAPNIDHSQDFVKADIKEWLVWLRTHVGFDGWRCAHQAAPAAARRRRAPARGAASVRVPQGCAC